MSVCPDPEEYSAYIDGEISKNLKKDLSKHLVNCEKCKGVVQEYIDIKKILILDEAPEINLDESFAYLVAKKNAKKIRTLYAFFALVRGKYAFLSFSFALIFILLFFCILTPKFYVLDSDFFTRRNKKFVPIVPMSYTTDNRMHFEKLNLTEMNMFADVPKKNNEKICSNFTNTFNNFSHLYSQFDNDESFNTIRALKFNPSPLYQYANNMPIYASLNKNAK